MCTILNPFALRPRKWKLTHAVLEVDCVYFNKVAPGMKKFAPAKKKGMKKLAPVVKRQAPVVQPAAPNRKWLRIATALKTKIGPIIKNSPHCKESGCNTQQICTYCFRRKESCSCIVGRVGPVVKKDATVKSKLSL